MQIGNIQTVVHLLSCNKESFLVYYNREDYPWVFVENPKACVAHLIIDKNIGEDLVNKNIIIPLIKDDEFKIHFVLGTIDGRVYKLNPEINIEKLTLEI